MRSLERAQEFRLKLKLDENYLLYKMLFFVFRKGFLAVVFVFFYLVFYKYNAKIPLQHETFFHIKDGSSSFEIADKLESLNIIENRLFFLMMRAANNFFQSYALQAGEYLITPDITYKDLFETFRKGKTVSYSLTVPEGATVYEIVEKINHIPTLEGDIKTLPQEGSLLPSTYFYKRGESRQALIGRMQDQMEKTLQALWRDKKTSFFKTPQEALTLASIVEKETAKESEYEEIVATLLNRMRKGMPLQSCPTVLYAQNKGKNFNLEGRALAFKDLSISSPYNTYKNKGLPPGPICCPGKKALASTLAPQEHPWLFFVSDGKGGHFFTKTFKDHLQYAKLYRKKRG